MRKEDILWIKNIERLIDEIFESSIHTKEEIEK